MFKESFKNKRVFLTGHTGFKGSWLLLMLHQLGAEVKGYALEPKNSFDLYNGIHGDEMCSSHIADIRDRERLQKELTNFEPDFVFHLAAQALVIDSYTHPVETFETNVMGTIHVMEALRKLTKPCVSVLVTTDKVYENFETSVPYPEGARLGGHDPYSNSKACAELAIGSYRLSFLNPSQYKTHRQSIASARSGNVIGGGDWSTNRLLPDIARALMAGEPVRIRNPRSVRPWQHVLDPLCGYLQLAAAMQNEPTSYCEAFNFGPEPQDERTVLDMCELAIKRWGKGSYELFEDKNAPHEAGLLRLSIDKAITKLLWQPRLHSVEAVEWTMDWYKYSYGNEREFTMAQIAKYLDRA